MPLLSSLEFPWLSTVLRIKSKLSLWPTRSSMPVLQPASPSPWFSLQPSHIDLLAQSCCLRLECSFQSPLHHIPPPVPYPHQKKKKKKPKPGRHLFVIRSQLRCHCFPEAFPDTPRLGWVSRSTSFSWLLTLVKHLQ